MTPAGEGEADGLSQSASGRRNPEVPQQHHPDFEIFFKEKFPELVKVGYWACGNLHDGKEAAAEVIAEMFVRWPTITHPWAYARVSLLHKISTGRQSAYSKNVTLMPPDRLPPDSDMCSDLYAYETEEWIEQELRRLPKKQQEVMRLFVLEGLSFKEIADIVGSSHEAVRKNASLARQFWRANTPSPPPQPREPSESEKAEREGR